LREKLAYKRLQQTIVDWRFHDEATKINAKTYNWTNPYTPPTDDPDLQEKFRKHVEKI
jgi:hypothetical protein